MNNELLSPEHASERKALYDEWKAAWNILDDKIQSGRYVLSERHKKEQETLNAKYQVKWIALFARQKEEANQLV